jgi:hypothetical protein
VDKNPFLSTICATAPGSLGVRAGDRRHGRARDRYWGAVRSTLVSHDGLRLRLDRARGR